MNGVKIMSSNSYQASLPAKILMQLVLEINEAGVHIFIECYIPQNSSYSMGSYDTCLKIIKIVNNSGKSHKCGELKYRWFDYQLLPPTTRVQ